MKQSILVLFFLPHLAFAQHAEPTDSLDAKTLSEVVVEAQMQSTSPTATTYFPSIKQKNAAQDAIDLLRKMAIPQIQINPTDNAVTDNAGAAVSVFINYMPASQEDMAGLRTTDVRKVEYLEFPTDPRFRGAMRAIHIIVQEYAYGGYTKLSADENVLTGLSSRVNVFTKFSYKKLTYDLFVAANNWDNRHTAYSTEGIYSLKDADGSDVVLARNEFADNAHFQQNQYPVTFRATYNSEKIQIRNTLGYSHSAYPIQHQSGVLTYSPGMAENYTFDRRNPSHSNSLSYQGTFYFALPNHFSVNAAPQFSYTHNNNTLTYTTSAAPDPIIRKARENAYHYRVDAYLNKQFANIHTLMLGINGGDYINRLWYSGNAVYSDRFHNAFAAGLLCYQLQTQKINLYTDAGICWEQSNINGIKNTDTYPFLHVNLRYAPHSRHAISTYFQYANNTPGIDAKASDLLRDNEFMYLTGNPLLSNSRHITFQLAYAWMPSNQFNLNAYGNFFELFDRQMTAYVPYDGGRALLRTYINDGNFVQGKIGVSANVKFLDNNLQFYVTPEQCFNRSTGIFKKNYNPFQVTAQVIYYLNQLYFQAFYQTPQKTMFSNSPRTHRSRDFYAASAGWANSDWNIRLTAYNIFNTHWDSADTYLETPLYKEHRTNFGTTSHARLNLSVTYTFGYGKKVQRGNEVGEQSGASSAIMK
ncbi:MAG: hypothetical protein J1F25_06430 [Prevotellaceae bacterium]|nr:hypothetical protein [Prevotellaceae bacterium]